MHLLFSLMRNAVVASVFLFSAQVGATQADLDAELDGYVATFESNNFQQQRRVMDKLIWAGITSPRLYDVIERKLYDLKGASDKAGKEQAAWYAKTLALSGNDKYRSSLNDIAENADAKKIRKHAVLSLERLGKYQRWNPVISAGLENAPSGMLEETRVKNMLATDDYELLRIGAKRVYHGHKTDQELVAMARKRLEQEWVSADNSNNDQIDAIAWLIKVMAESGLKDNKPLLDQIAAESDSKKVRKYAKKYAAYLQ